MIEIKVLSNKEAKNRFCNNEEGSNKIISELTKRTLEKGLAVVTMKKKLTEYTASDMEDVRKNTLLYGYRTIYAIGLGSTRNEIVLACEKI